MTGGAKAQKVIIFVDDDPLVLQGLRRLLHEFRHEWQMEFVGNADAALALVDRGGVDAVITDIRLAGKSGLDLLLQVKAKSPNTLRFTFSGQTDKDSILRSAEHVHQFITKPVDARQVKIAIDRSITIRDSLSSLPLRQLVAHFDSMPSIPTVYHELMNELRSPNASMRQVAEIVSRDVGLTTKLLRTVNSVAFGLPRQVATVAQAVNILGLEMIKGLVLPVQLFSQSDLGRMPYLSIERLWEHSVRVGALSKQIMADLGGTQLQVDHAFTAGLLSDAGILLLASKMPELYTKVATHMNEYKMPLFVAEESLLGTTHAEIGAYLMALWSLPTPIVEALTYHHKPSGVGALVVSPLTALHIASALCQAHFEHDETQPCLDQTYIGELGIAMKTAEWKGFLETLESTA